MKKFYKWILTFVLAYFILMLGIFDFIPSLKKLRERFWWKCFVAKIQFKFKMNEIPFIITSKQQGTHINSSLHYEGLAIDIRSRDLTLDQIDIIDKWLMNDTQMVDWVWESDHLHIEYDPI